MNWDVITIIALVAAGGAIGAVLRYCVGHMVDSSQFPWGTLLVNLVGCTLLAFLFFSFGDQMSDTVRYFLFIGVFGAFTTMSTFTLDTVTLFYDGHILSALENVILNGGVCLLGAFLGRYAALLLI